MINSLVPNETRPNRLDGKKDAAYHAKFARWCASTGMNNPLHIGFLWNNFMFWRFYNGDQWIFNDDLGAFLTDESGNARNRVKLCFNIIRPMVHTYIGMVNKSGFAYKAKNISPGATSRRDEQLELMLFLTREAATMKSPMGAAIRQQYGLPETEDETKELFDSTYSDQYEKGINRLLKWSEEHNTFNQNTIQLAKYLAVTGICIHESEANCGEQDWLVTDPSFFHFDRAAKRPDLKDASFQGTFYFKSPPDIYERWDVNAKTREKIERFTKDNGQPLYNTNWGTQLSTNDKLIVYREVWKDTEKEEYGFILDGEDEVLVQINRVDPDTGEVTGYTDKDIIKPKNKKYATYVGKNKKKIIYKERLRYCYFTPKEVCSDEAGNDIIYEYGLLPYEEQSVYKAGVEYPFKCQTLDYHDGVITSPINDVISPQRMINRALSASDSQINQAQLSTVAFDSNAIDSQGGEDELRRSLALGRPIKMDTSRMGITNVITPVSSSVGSNISAFMNYSEMMKNIGQSTTGVTDTMQGQNSGANDLVGVQEIKLQQGSIAQEGFNNCIEDILRQTYQCVAESGKRIYAENPYRLSQIVGDESEDAIELTKNMCSESFRVFIKRTAAPEQQRAEVNLECNTNFQLGLIGDEEYAYMLENSDLDEMPKAIRMFTKRKAMQAKMQQEQQMAIAQAQEQAQAQNTQIALQEASAEREVDYGKAELGAQTKLQVTAMKEKGDKEKEIIKGQKDIVQSVVEHEHEKEIVKMTPKPVNNKK